MAYSLGIRCLSEFLGMIIVIYTGEAALANELLPSTKGHAMGWGWTVFTFGFAFLAPLQIFSKVSAKLNPAMCLAQWVWGNLNGIEFICLSLAEIAGAFVGAVFHWIHYLPHYKTLPEPAPENRDEGLLRRRDHMRDSALQIASYATRPDRKVSRSVIHNFKNTFYYLKGNSVIHEESPEEILDEYYHDTDVIERRVSGTAPKGENPLARRTVQVADLQRHLQDNHIEKVLRLRMCPRCTGPNTQSFTIAGPGAGSAVEQSSQPMLDAASRPDILKGVGQRAGPGTQFSLSLPPTPTPSNRQARMISTFGSVAFEKERDRVNALYQAAVIADQNAKLSIFATRPAISSPLYNFITEGMGTTTLLLLALLIEMQARRFTDENFKLFYEITFQNLLICFVIVVLIAGLGGPTAYAANPARDFGPRVAHALLPIPGKGGSEWSYAWIPFFAPLVGGALAGVLFLLIEQMQFPGDGRRSGLFVG